MDVKELTQEELYELKATLYWELFDNGEIKEIAPEAEYPNDLPDDLVYEKYAGISFVKDDFFCNQCQYV